jgi:TonB family protein
MMDNRDIMVVFFALSLLAHLMLFRFFNLDAPAASLHELSQLQAQDSAPKKINITPIDKATVDKLEGHQVIEVPPGPDEQPDHAKYLAERAMKAAQDIMARPAQAFAGHAAPPNQTQAQAQTQTQNSARPSSTLSSRSLFDPSSAGSQPLPGQSDKDKSEKGESPADKLKLKPAEAASLFSNSPTMGGAGHNGGGGIDFMAGAAVGDITMANTYKFQHAAWFNQLKRSIAFYWNPEPALSLLPLNDVELITRVRFVINKDGTLADMEVLDSSQYQSVDRAAETAIKNSTPVFGVPEELLDQDHQLSIICEFRIQVGGR